ncbi:MAG TPA: glycosyl transferase family 1 [Planktothrix sp. UBA8407]|nr:glycosyl transferase family 1 [Planktothrix sp. UBA8407]HBK24594.1 glycosyl transferase family 1 [Planktothrix sp. UBA10369]
MLLKVLSERGENIDVVAYPEGRNVTYNNVTLYRTIKVPGCNNVRPGFSVKKLVYDILMIFKVLQLTFHKKYDLIHAVEETSFIALLIKFLFKIPYVYDMDSSLAQQMVEKYPQLSPVKSVFNHFEGLAVKHAKAVVPVCQALANDIAEYNPKKVVLLTDVSLLKSNPDQLTEDLKQNLNINNLLMMYVGNLESYQGIDLLLDSFAIALKQTQQADLVIIGGEPGDIQFYQQKAQQLGISDHIHFLGKKPTTELDTYLYQADILVSPRTKGKNTPLKIYSYLDSGKAVLATDLLTHTQVLNTEVAQLAAPDPEAFAQGMVNLIDNGTLRAKLGEAGKALVQEKYSYTAFRQQANRLYDELKQELLPN